MHGLIKDCMIDHICPNLSCCCYSWNLEACENLPEYMKPIYSAMLTFGNELADKHPGLNTLPFIKKEVRKSLQSFNDIQKLWPLFAS